MMEDKEFEVAAVQRKEKKAEPLFQASPISVGPISSQPSIEDRGLEKH